MDRERLLADFVTEANERLAEVERSLVAFEREPGELRHVHEIFQAVHGIKGIAGYVELQSVNRVSHEMETLLDRLRRGVVTVDGDIVDVVLGGVDLIRSCVQHPDESEHRREDVAAWVGLLKRIEPDDAPAARPVHRAVEVDRGLFDVFLKAADQHIEALFMAAADLPVEAKRKSALRIARRSLKTIGNSASYLGVAELDHVLNRLTDVLEEEEVDAEAFTGGVETLSHTVAMLRDDTEQPAAPASEGDSFEPAVEVGTDLPRSVEDTLRVAQRKLDEFMNLVSDLVLARNAVAHLASRAREEASSDLARLAHTTSLQLNKVTMRLQDQVMAIRMVPMRYLFDRYPRVVRDLARDSSRDVRLVTLGDDTEVDKGVADLLNEPLVHLIRNAIAHGIESPADRLAAGKPAMGTITLKAEHEGSFVSIEVLDDGAGIDVAGVRHTAVRRGLVLAEEAAGLSDAELVDMLFRPGFSTAATSDEISGRGVGLDAVSSNVKRFGGNVQVDWEPGAGARFRIKIPLTLSVIQTLVVQAGGQRYAVPANFVEENLTVNRSRISRINNVDTFIYQERPVPLFELSTLLGADEDRSGGDQCTAVVLAFGSRRVGLVVDRIVVQQDALIRPLDSELGKLAPYSGATVLDDGSLILILNPPGLLASHASRRARA